MAFPSPKKKGGGTILLLLCCCAAATDPGALLSPTPCSPQLPPRGQTERSRVSPRGKPHSGMYKKNTLHRAPVVQGPLGSDWIAVLGMDGRLLLARSGRV